MKSQKLFSTIDSYRDDMVRTLMQLLRIPAIAPDNGGEGEIKKAEKLMRILEPIGFDEIQRYDVKDERVPSKRRPNIVCYLRGEGREERLWIVTHMDVVPPGEEKLWTVTPPFDPKVKDDKIFARGSEDNGQSLVASLYAVKALIDSEIDLKRTVALAFVADEEQGSVFGIQHLIDLGLFRKNDLVVVPDYGNPQGDFIEVAEKSMLMFKIRTQGKQVHASTPDKGLNAHRAGMEYALTIDKMLHETYSDKEESFTPPESTFEPTMKEKNVGAVNIIPGEDIIFFDCRILPRYSLKKVLKDIHLSAEEFEEQSGAKINLEMLKKNKAPPPTELNSKIVIMLKEAIQQVRGITPRVGGIGGGTCASFFRQKEIPTVVWSTIDETAHQPDEYSRINHLVNDAKIFVYLTLS
ncbi:MAG: M20 family metallo-hydrolase [Thermoproteota archaeon]